MMMNDFKAIYKIERTSKFKKDKLILTLTRTGTYSDLDF